MEDRGGHGTRLLFNEAEVAVALIEGRDIFTILPTGFSKILCYACLPVAFDRRKKERGDHE